METKKAKGSGFLKVTGILMIIFGAIALILSIIAIIGVAAIGYLMDGAISMGIYYASGILLLLSSIAELIAGIIGVKNCNKPEKAGTCIAWGVIVAILCVAGTVLTSVAGGTFNTVSLVSGLLFPVLFIIGAYLNKKSA